MNIESLREYCISKVGVAESFPFDSDTLVFKIENKIFLLTNLAQPYSFNVKCDPERAIILREEFEEIQPGFHMNKMHWNTVSIIGSLTNVQLLEMIDHSYDLVLKSLPQNLQQSIKNNELERRK